jgi:SAM-dependent methyltransferase
MTQNPSASDWANTRGEQWLAQISGMEAMLRPVDEPLIAALRLDAPLRIAEVGSGGGGTTLDILRRAPAGSVVHGFDISKSLVELARERAGAKQGVAFGVADMATAGPEQPYDRLVSRFGIMFFDDPQAAFTNLARWLKPGGRFAFAAWGPATENLWLTRVREVLSRIIELPQPDPEAPGPYRYADASKLFGLLERAGFAELDVRDFRSALPIGESPSEAAHFALSAFSAFAELLAKAGGAAREEALRALTASFSDQQPDGVVQMEACVRIFTGASQ